MASGGHSSSRCVGLSPSRPLFLWSTGSRCTGSVIVAQGSSCSAACGIFPDQGSNPCPLHWQADSQPLRHQGSPWCFLIFISTSMTYLCNFKEPKHLPCALEALLSLQWWVSPWSSISQYWNEKQMTEILSLKVLFASTTNIPALNGLNTGLHFTWCYPSMTRDWDDV